MRILVTGSRDWADEEVVFDHLASYFRESRDRLDTLVHGDCRGADKIAAHVWAHLGGNVEAHPAKWGEHGKAAGMIRNNHMVSLGADICLAFLLPQSRGTRQCADAAEAAGIKTVRIWG